MSWQTVKGEGIVLLAEPFREADRLYTILTKEYGKIRVLGRGAQRAKAKLAPFLEPYSVLDLEWIEGQRSVTVISADRKARFLGIEADYHRRNLALIAGQELNRHSREQDSHQELYGFFHEWLQELNAAPVESYTRKVFMLGGYFLQLLRHMGYQTELQHCLVCTHKIMPLSYRWHAGKGGLVCSDCVRKDEKEWHAAGSLHEDVLRLLRFSGDTTFAQLRHMHLPGGHVAEFIQVVDDLIKYHLPDAQEKPFWAHVLEDLPINAFTKAH